MSPFKISLFSRIGSSVLSAIGAIGDAVSAIIGEHFYDFTEQNTNSFVGAGGGESVINDYLVADGNQLNYFRSPLVSTSGANTLKSYYFEFYLATQIISNDTTTAASCFLESVTVSADNRIILGQVTASYSPDNVGFRTTTGTNWGANLGIISVGNHTLLFEYNGSAWTVSLDGAAAIIMINRNSGSPSAGTMTTAQVLSIMQRPSSSSFRDFQVNGYISRFQITDSNDDIILDFKNIYGANGTTYDWSGYTFTRYVGNATKRETITVPGQYRIENTSPTKPEFTFGNALKFDGVNDYVDFNETYLTGKSQFTINLWFYRENSASASRQYIFWHGSFNNYGVAIGVNFDTSNKLGCRARNSGTEVQLISTSDIPINSWQFVSFVFDSVNDQHYLFLNGVQEASSTVNAGTVLARTASGLGADMSNSSSLNFIFQGRTDELSIVDTPLTLTNHQTLYNNGNGYLATDLFTPDRYYQFNEDDGETTLIDTMGNQNGTLNNFSTPPAYFIPH